MEKRSSSVEKMVANMLFWKNKRVFLTGHTGFKGAWLSYILTGAEAELTGYALSPPTEPSLFDICQLSKKMKSVIGDIRDREALYMAFEECHPEIVIHMAAQPLVRESYSEPAYTYETNVMGTVNILECVRQFDTVKSFLNVTTDKVYHNYEWEWGYREIDVLGGFDPYSNSKACSELVTQSYLDSFFKDRGVAVSTARSGNVIGGGDFAKDRIIPDAIRSIEKNEKIFVRRPNSIRPYQHVLEPLFAYLLIAQKQYVNRDFAGCYNIGPDDEDCVTTCTLVDLFCRHWGEGCVWESGNSAGPHEAGFLKLDSSKMKSALNWKPTINIETAIVKTVEWTRALFQNGDVKAVMDSQIEKYSMNFSKKSDMVMISDRK